MAERIEREIETLADVVPDFIASDLSEEVSLAGCRTIFNPSTCLNTGETKL